MGLAKSLRILGRGLDWGPDPLGQHHPCSWDVAEFTSINALFPPEITIE